jgi:hypothetical protein
LYIEQKIIRTGKLEDLTAEELETKMKKIMEDYAPIMEGVTVEEMKQKVKEKKIDQVEELTPIKDVTEN